MNRTRPSPQTERDPNARRTVLTNRRARHEYEILDTIDAGIELRGTEVKSIRAGQVDIQDAYARIENGQVWLHNMHVRPYEHGSHWNEEPRRPRRLLLHRREIGQLRVRVEHKGLSLVPLSLFFQRGYAKLEIGLGRGKRLYDRREAIARRDEERQRQRDLAARE
ncbi:MAG: SsrA-binding protein SmpB [Chthonomonadales bacterium]|nr:SsrA-binding protein SmpB [Chthonomonadales bacterium]